MMAFWACSRFWAWSNTMLRGPSSTPSVISSPAMGGQAVHHQRRGLAAATSGSLS